MPQPWEVRPVPDDEDYAELARLIADPTSWTGRERSTMGILLSQQEALLTAVHPAHTRRRNRLQELVDQIHRAISIFESTRREGTELH